jgi:hypothetical protein
MTKDKVLRNFVEPGGGGGGGDFDNKYIMLSLTWGWFTMRFPMALPEREGCVWNSSSESSESVSAHLIPLFVNVYKSLLMKIDYRISSNVLIWESRVGVEGKMLLSGRIFCGDERDLFSSSLCV